MCAMNKQHKNANCLDVNISKHNYYISRDTNLQQKLMNTNLQKGFDSYVTKL